MVDGSYLLVDAQVLDNEILRMTGRPSPSIHRLSQSLCCKNLLRLRHSLYSMMLIARHNIDLLTTYQSEEIWVDGIELSWGFAITIRDDLKLVADFLHIQRLTNACDFLHLILVTTKAESAAIGHTQDAWLPDSFRLILLLGHRYRIFRDPVLRKASDIAIVNKQLDTQISLVASYNIEEMVGNFGLSIALSESLHDNGSTLRRNHVGKLAHVFPSFVIVRSKADSETYHRGTETRARLSIDLASTWR